MKRTIKLDTKLSAFDLTLDELEALCQTIEKLFSDTNKIHKWIRVNYENEDIEFKNVDELRDSAYLKENITKFSIHFTGDESSVSIRTNHILDQIPTLSMSSTKVGWCQLANETICSYLTSHKKPRAFLVKLPFIRIILSMIFVGLLVAVNVPEKYSIPNSISLSYFLLIASLSFFMLIKDKILPGGKIIVHDNEPFYKKYAIEIGLFLALISAITSVVSILR